MKKRVISTICLWLTVILVVLITRVHGAVILLTALALLAQFELYRILERCSDRPWLRQGLVSGGIIMLSAYYGCRLTAQPALLAGSLIAIGLFVRLLMQGRLQQNLNPTLLGLVLIPGMLQFYIALMVDAETGTGSRNAALFLPVWVIAVAKFSDVGGLLVGSRIGRNKLSPAISPNKTWEGAFGGIIFSVLTGWILGYAFNMFTYAPWWLLGLLAIPIAVTAIVSDLFESYLKRVGRVKDSGNCIPGIGGAFDLIDSLMFTGPVAYLLFSLFVF